MTRILQIALEAVFEADPVVCGRVSLLLSWVWFSCDELDIVHTDVLGTGDSVNDGIGDVFGIENPSCTPGFRGLMGGVDGTVPFSIFGPDDELQDAIEDISVPVDVTIEAVSGLAGTTAAVETLLADRQRQVVETGVGLGYFDNPRTASREDIAAELDSAPSTIAEHLRKAE